MLKVLIEHDQLLTNFGKDQLDEDIINDAEEFLVRVVASKKSSNARHLMILEQKCIFIVEASELLNCLVNLEL